MSATTSGMQDRSVLFEVWSICRGGRGSNFEGRAQRWQRAELSNLGSVEGFWWLRCGSHPLYVWLPQAPQPTWSAFPMMCKTGNGYRGGPLYLFLSSARCSSMPRPRGSRNSEYEMLACPATFGKASKGQRALGIDAEAVHCKAIL